MIDAWAGSSMAAAVIALSVLAGGEVMAQDQVGVVLMHGKSGSPEHVQGLAQHLRAAGYRVVTPNMPWSKVRAYDRSLEEAHAEIDGWVAELEKQGATRVVVAGHSMGGNMAMGYAATHSHIAGVMAIGPGQTVESKEFRQQLGESVRRAKAMIVDGRGDEKALFADLHLGEPTSARTTARIYLSYFDPDRLANMPAVAPRIAVPFLWIVGTLDKNLLKRGRGYAFELAQANPLNRYVEVHSDHMGTPEASRAAVSEWLRSVFSVGARVHGEAADPG